MKNKIINFFKSFLINDPLKSFTTYKEHLIKSSSSIFLNNSSITFHTKKEQNKKYLTIGENCLIKANFIFETEKGQVTIGNNVHLGGITFISRNSITIKDDVTMAWDITIYDHNSHSVNWENRKIDNHQCYDDYINNNSNNIVNKNWLFVKDAPIVIESKVWIGFGVTILKGVTIGEGAVVGAKSVITKDVPAWSVVAGNPAVVVKNLNSKEN